MTFDRATQILQAHGHQSRPSTKPGHISGQFEWVQNGVVGTDWEDIKLSASAIRDWLGY